MQIRGGEENALLIQLGTARCPEVGQRPSFPILIQTNSAPVEDLDRPSPQGRHRQERWTPVDPLYLFSCGVLWHQQKEAVRVGS
jgi:hypothetical protein